MLSPLLIPDTPVHADWLNYPIVALAFRQSGGDAASGLERLSALLAHVEDQCPNVDYVRLFDTKNLDGLEACDMALQLQSFGVEAGDDLLEDLFDVPVDQDTRTSLRRASAKDLRAQGFKLAEIAKAIGVSSPSTVWELLRTEDRQSRTQPLRKPSERMFREAEASRRLGSHVEAARELDCWPQSVYASVKAVKAWEARQ